MMGSVSRECSYEEAVEIIKEMFEGKTLKYILNEREITNYQFHKTRSQFPEIEEMYGRAKIAVTELDADELKDIADNEPDPQRARNKIDVRKFLMGKHNPKTYGDKIDVNIMGHIDVAKALSAGEKLLSQRYPKKELEAEDAELILPKLSSGSGQQPEPTYIESDEEPDAY
jgi:hypothetical protein